MKDDASHGSKHDADASTASSAAGDASSSHGSSAGESRDAAMGARHQDASVDEPPAPFDVAALAPLSACPGSILELFDEATIKPPKGGSGVFHAVDAARFDALEASVRALARGDIEAAQKSAQGSAYELCRVDDEGSAVVVVRPQQSGEGHAVLAWRLAPEHPLIVEAPHAWHDADTDIQGTELFLALKARALILSGIYRCASLAAGPCDGYTTACTGVPMPYTESDAAHNSEMLFQAAHVALSESFAQDLVISLHGFSYDGVSVSNSTISDDSPSPGSLHVRLVAALQKELPDEKITSCQKYEGAPYEDRMCGSENVQGRHVNGSSNVCARAATITSNRFVHMEQSRAVRDNRAAVLNALRTALD